MYRLTGLGERRREVAMKEQGGEGRAGRDGDAGEGPGGEDHANWRGEGGRLGRS